MKRFGLIGIVVMTAAAVALVGCASAPETPDASRPEFVREELTSLVRSDQPQNALPRITALRSDSVLEERELSAYAEQAVTSMGRILEDSIASRDYDAALIQYWSLVAIGARARDDEFESTLHLERARLYAEDGDSAASLASLLRAPALESLPVEALEDALESAVRLNNRAAAAEIVAALAEAGASTVPDIEGFLTIRESPVDMLDGVVTIFVNKGLRLERGVGIPDRVIGSGFFIDPRGYVVTNYHVIESEVDPEYEGYSILYVRMREDPAQRIPARVVGFSPIFDVAVLKVEVDAPYVFGFSNARELEPGSRIYAIGSPGGLENSISSGVISATGRRFLQMGDTMQIDVPINPGNSGGPLLDDSGRLVGVVFAGIEQFEGVNFAIPAYWINRFLPELHEESTVPHPWIGVAVEEHPDGLEVIYVALESAAERAGIVVGDVIRAIDDEPVGSVPEAHEVLLQRAPQTLVSLSLADQSSPRSTVVSLEQRPRRPVIEAFENDLRQRLFPVLYGMRVERTGQDLFRPVYSVDRVYRGSTADEIGITEGDRFTELGFDLRSELQVVLLQMFIQKRTEGFVRTNLQLPAFVERDNFL